MTLRATILLEYDPHIEFDAALEAYIEGADGEELLRAAASILDSDVPLDPTRAGWIAEMAGSTKPLDTYSDGAHAVRRYFAMLEDRGTEH
jgi:hypothetical protein